MKKWKIFLTALLSIMMILPHDPVSIQAKTTAGHTVFSKKEVENRIKKIQDYYYNKKKSLKIRNQNICLSSGKNCKISYYIHGKDLMFGYGSSEKTEYRMYFYKNQLIRLLVDRPEKKRKTYQQLYKKLDTIAYDANLDQYMMFENYARKLMEYATAKTKKILTNQPVLITKVSGNDIIYHELNCYGSDGAMWSISKKTYKAKVNSKVIVLDGSNNPNRYDKQNMNWLKKRVSDNNIGYAVYLSAKGKTISKIEGIYFA